MYGEFLLPESAAYMALFAFYVALFVAFIWNNFIGSGVDDAPHKTAVRLQGLAAPRAGHLTFDVIPVSDAFVVPHYSLV